MFVFVEYRYVLLPFFFHKTLLCSYYKCKEHEPVSVAMLWRSVGSCEVLDVFQSLYI